MIKITFRKFSFLFIIALLASVAGADEKRTPFEPASTVEESIQQHKLIPDPNKGMWWELTGKDMAWNNKNLHQFFPTVNVYRDGPVKELGYKLRGEIYDYPVDTPDGPLRFVDFLDSDHSTSMGVVVLHRGNIVFEHYARMKEYQKPIWWSVTKVFPSTLIAILEDRGLVDVTKHVDFYLPELKNSDFSGVTVRNVLDMASGVDCPDGDYHDFDTCYSQLEASLNNAVRNKESPDTAYEALSNMRPGRSAEQGTRFEYSGANTMVLSWIVERVMGMPFQDAVSKEIWNHIGAEGDASMLAGRYGVANTPGGFLAKPRDMARFGLLFTPSYKVVSDKKIISDRYLDIIINGGRPELLQNAISSFGVPGEVKHNVYQWDRVFKNNDAHKGGWAGQGLLFNPDRDIVVAYVGYKKDVESSEMSVLAPLREILNELYGN